MAAPVPAAPPAPPAEWSAALRIAAVRLSDEAGVRPLDPADPASGPGRLGLVLFDAARRFAQALTGAQAVTLDLQLRGSRAAGAAPGADAPLSLRYVLRDGAGRALAESGWREIAVPAAAPAGEEALAAAIAGDIAAWARGLGCLPGRDCRVSLAGMPPPPRPAGRTQPPEAAAPPGPAAPGPAVQGPQAGPAVAVAPRRRPVPAARRAQPGMGEARWIGSTPAAPAAESRPGLWVATDMVEVETPGWVADESTGATIAVRLMPLPPGRLARAEMSEAAMRALGLVPGQHANLSVYLPR